MLPAASLLAAALWLACLPSGALACVACREAARSIVYGDGFGATLLALLLPVALVLAAGLAIYRLAPPRREPADAGTES